jgi:hypothetical protein
MQHPEEGTIHAWLDGALPATEASALESHVATCAECEARVAEARGLIAASSRIVRHLDAVPANVIPVAPRKRRLVSWRNPWIAAIAAVLILAVRGYLNRPGVDGLREVPPSPSTSEVGRPRLADSVALDQPAPIARQRASAPPPPANAGSRRSPSLADSVIAPTLPPANAAAQKTTVASAPPTAAPQPPRKSTLRAAETRADVQAADTRVATSTGKVGSRAPGGMAAGAAVATAAPPAAAAVERGFAKMPDEAPSAFVGCYVMNASTEILPARFALATDSSAIPGLLRMQYVDGDGLATQPIADVGWAVEGGEVVVKTQARETLLTLQKTGSSVSGQSRSGPRNGRVTSCSK